MILKSNLIIAGETVFPVHNHHHTTHDFHFPTVVSHHTTPQQTIFSNPSHLPPPPSQNFVPHLSF